MKLTRKEQTILEVLWQTDQPLCVSDIIALNKNLSKNTVSVLIKKLLDYGMVYVADIRKNGKTLAQYYRPVQTKDEFILSTISEKEALNIAVTFIEKEASDEELEKLLLLIENKISK
ncbi:BlaI/MecI/CopY family transcriptional regulator [Enterococcus cecorum]|uniref:BlaI/MecI/CopY family transcriptional regulator n=1 Tax=Enterococcus cecorum TaxID=44008 RepID=UPI003F236EFC